MDWIDRLKSFSKPVFLEGQEEVRQRNSNEFASGQGDRLFPKSDAIQPAVAGYSA